MNRRSFIARTIATAGALVAGKSAAEAVPIAGSPAGQGVYTALASSSYDDMGVYSDVITTLGNGTFRRERFVTDESGQLQRISAVDYHSATSRRITLPVGSDDDEYSDE